jgi:hypothetical protein
VLYGQGAVQQTSPRPRCTKRRSKEFFESNADILSLVKTDEHICFP